MGRSVFVPVVLALLVLAGGCRDMGPGGGGKVSEVVYGVTGHGDVDVRYSPDGTKTLSPAQTVHLPWRQSTEAVDDSGLVYRVFVRAPDLAGIHCSIEVNGVEVRDTVQRKGTVMECSFVK